MIRPICAQCGERSAARINGGSLPTTQHMKTWCEQCRRKARKRRAERPCSPLRSRGVGTQTLWKLVARFGGYEQAVRAAEWVERGMIPVVGVAANDGKERRSA